MSRRTVSSRWRSNAAIVLVALILATPSMWFLAKIPPLWRDIDAYIQTTAEPGPSTILLHAPLYGFAARIPLYVGHLFAASGDETKSFGEFFIAPQLTDAGVFLLLFLQHAALLAVQLYFIATVATRMWVRVLLAICFAANPMLYTFAHCVGSETLSAIGIVLLATLGLRLVRAASPPPRQWIGFAVVLLLLLLTRQINAVLITLLPLALLPLLARTEWLRPLARQLAVAVLVGVVAFGASIGCTRLVAAAADLDYRSKIGFTFMWRMRFLQKLDPDDRDRVVRNAAARAGSPETKALIERLGELFGKGESPDMSGFVRQQRELLFAPGSEDVAERTDAALNGMPLAFLKGSPAALINAAAADVVTARRITIRQLTEFPFWSTAYYFGHEAALPQFAKLSSFRGRTRDELIAFSTRSPYLWRWRSVTFDRWLMIWFAALVVCFAIARARHVDEVVPTCSYATALVLTGLLMMLLNSFLTELLPRYSLPMFELTFLSLAILVGRIGEIAAAKPPTHATTS